VPPISFRDHGTWRRGINASSSLLPIVPRPRLAAE
jgi:hypothetical protein